MSSLLQPHYGYGCKEVLPVQVMLYCKLVKSLGSLQNYRKLVEGITAYMLIHVFNSLQKVWMSSREK